MPFTDEKGLPLAATLRDSVLQLEALRRVMRELGSDWSNECILEDGRPLCCISQNGRFWQLVPDTCDSPVHPTRGVWGKDNKFIGKYEEILLADRVNLDGTTILCLGGQQPLLEQPLDAVLQLLRATEYAPSIPVEL